MNASTSYTVYKLSVEMDRRADRLLQRDLGLSYSRFYFLLVISQHAPATQHMVAQALGYSDPAVSNMVAQAVKEGYVIVSRDSTHRRKRIVNLTENGQSMIEQSTRLLDACFSEIARMAGVDEVQYALQNQKLIKALTVKNSEEEL